MGESFHLHLKIETNSMYDAFPRAVRSLLVARDVATDCYGELIDARVSRNEFLWVLRSYD